MHGKSIFIYLVLLFCAASQVNFTQQVNTPLEDISKEAELILTGKVTQQTSDWNKDKSRIYTVANIQVEEYIKGNAAGNTVSIKYLGGEVGEVGEIYSHMPRFKDNEVVLVFLKKENNGNDYKVFNGEDGKISLVFDPKTGELVTSSNIRVSALKTQIKNYIND